MRTAVEGPRVCKLCSNTYDKKYGMCNNKCTACISKTKYHRNKEYYREYHKVRQAYLRKTEYEKIRARERRYSEKRDLLQERYNITSDDYVNLLNKQGGVCAICSGLNTFKNSSRNLYVDHDHKSGKIRGLLCNHCNTGLGHFKDDTSRLLKAIEYLQVSNPELD